MGHVMGIMWIMSVFPSDCRIQHPYLLLKSGQSLKLWNKLKILLHPNILYLPVHYLKVEHPLIGLVIGKYVFLTFANKDIVVHSHVGIRSNETADYAAKPALDLPRVKVGVPYTDFRQYILSTRKDLLERCDCELASFLKPVLGDWQSSYRQGKEGNVLFNDALNTFYLRLYDVVQAVQEGRSCLVSSQHQSRIFEPFLRLTVRYISVECSYLAQTRRDILGPRNVMESKIISHVVVVAGFLSDYLSRPLPYVQRHITVMC